MPLKNGIQKKENWIPAYAGMTKKILDCHGAQGSPRNDKL